MKNASANKKQIGSQNSTQNMRYTTKCMTQSAFQKKILSLVQRAGDKVAEAMNIVDELGAITGINVHFERGERSKLTEGSEQGRRNKQDGWTAHRANHSRHSEGNLCNQYDHNNHVDASDIFYESDEADVHDESYDLDKADYSDEIKEVTLPELADMVAERTCFKPECTLCVLNTAFDIMDEQNLILDLGTISADTSEEDTEGTEGTDTEDDETYAECGCHDCDNCRHYDNCYGKSDSGYDEYNENSSDDGDDEYNCEDDIDIDDYNDGHECDDDYDDDKLVSQPTRNTSRRDRQW